MQASLKIVWSILFSLSFLYIKGADTLFVDHSSGDYNLTSNYLSIFRDSSRTFEIEDLIREDKAHWFRPPESTNPHAFDPQANYWVRFTVKGKVLTQKGWILEAADPRINEIAVFYKKTSGKMAKEKAGMLYTFDQKPYQHKNFVFELPNDQEQFTFYVQIKSSTQSALLFRIRSFEFFTFYALYEYYLLGLFYGILAIMSLYNLLLYFTFKESLYLYYTLYVASCILITFAEDGLGFHFIWGKIPELNYFVFNISPLLFLVSFAVYSISFLELRQRLPFIYKGILFFTGLTCLYFIIKILRGHYGWNVTAYILPFTLIYIGGLVRWRQNFRPAGYFVIAYTFTIAAVYITALRINKFLEWDNIFTIYILNFSLVVEVLLLSLAQADRFRQIKLDKERVQEEAIGKLQELNLIKDRINREIEARVDLQTKELREKKEIIELQNHDLSKANEQLKRQAEEISRMNQLLSQEKEALQVNVKALTQARIFASKVDFGEFRKIFPDDDSCYEYLSKLKWEKGYACRRCQGDTYTKGQGHYARRCTRCGHNESATSQTLFHRLHFPILKGFYLLFLVYANKGNITAAELSEILSLRHNTCWKFSKKIKEKMQSSKSRKSQGEGTSDNGWSTLILDD